MIEKLTEAASYIRSRCPLRPKVAITLGSGLASFGNKVSIDCEIAYADIPFFVPPTVDGHPGKLLLGHIGKVPVAILQGRLHYYEGLKLEQVVFPTRVVAQIGVETLILTNASGGLDSKMKPGDFMIIEDHINLTGNNPLIGPNIQELGLRFPDMSEPYDKKLNDVLASILKKRSVPFHRGIYCGVSGPTYETAAEVRYLHQIGGHAVGMSTVPETIAAKHMGLRVCGIACITNLATGLVAGKVTHEDVKETGAKVEAQFSDFLYDFVSQL